MKTLNLANPEKTDIKFKISKFPDGQQDVTILDIPMTEEEWFDNTDINSALYDSFSVVTPVQIKSRFNSFKDLELIICATICLKRLGISQIHLYIPYIVGARSDREFIVGGTSYLRDVIAPILNYQKYESITCIDPHSDVAAACINNLKIIDNTETVIQAINSFYDVTKGWSESKPLDNVIFISPDAGAQKKIYKVADKIGYTGEVITCSKSRDVDGKLTKLVIPVSTIVHKDYIIIDDICDGGATFLNIAKTLKPRLHESNRIFLIVTHGIFSKGLKELNQYFDGIYCTNSYIDMKDNEFSLVNDKHLHKLKQLNVF